MNFSEFLQLALLKAGKNEALASEIGISASALSKRINGEVGWSEDDLNKLLNYNTGEIVFQREFTEKVKTLKEAFKIFLNEGS